MGKSKVAVMVPHVFFLINMANWALFLILVCHKLLYSEIIFYIHLCHVSLECPEPRQPWDA